MCELLPLYMRYMYVVTFRTFTMTVIVGGTWSVYFLNKIYIPLMVCHQSSCNESPSHVATIGT